LLQPWDLRSKVASDNRAGSGGWTERDQWTWRARAVKLQP